ncbi:hypothetical protein G6009_05540 [Dietzia sp. SLG510A3-30A2]|nr:hypothetical protein [Dietzia sp. SLG510A3-30A2]
MPNDTSRPWLDAHTAAKLTEDDLAALDHTAELAATLWRTRKDHIDYMRGEAQTAARVRQFVGPNEIPLPEFVQLPNAKATWELTPQRNDAVRYLEAEHADTGKLTACLEADQHALSGQIATRVTIDVGETSDPAELVNWALDLLALAERWKRIRKEGQA